MSGPRIFTGAEKFTAVMSGDVHRSDGAIFQQAMPEVQSMLFADDGFLTRTFEAQERLDFYANHITSATAGNIVQLYRLNNIEELPIVSGRMLHYCMSEPKLKQLYLDGEYDTIGYTPDNDGVGAKDTYYQQVHDGKVVPTMDGYQTLEWVYETPNPLSTHEQFIMIRNHSLISKNIEQVVYNTDRVISKEGIEGLLISIGDEDFIKY